MDDPTLMSLHDSTNWIQCINHRKGAGNLERGVLEMERQEGGNGGGEYDQGALHIYMIYSKT